MSQAKIVPLVELRATTNIDGKPFEWTVSGDFAWGSGPSLYSRDCDVLHKLLGDQGYRIVTMPAGFSEAAQEAISRFLDGYGLSMEEYHLRVDDDQHQQVIGKSRNLSLAELGWDGGELCDKLSDAFDLGLSPDIPDLGRDHVQVRINRPSSTDFNPPHRDGALPVFRNTVNIWITIFGCNEHSSLPLLPGSHLLAEAECYQTGAGGAYIRGRKYNVAAIVRTKDGNLEMQRPSVGFGQAILFTPYLVHGIAVNFADLTRISLELRLTVKDQTYPDSAPVV